MTIDLARCPARETIAALLLAAGTTAVALALNTWAAGGADASGYASQAQLWLTGRLTVSQPLAANAPWPDASWTFSPLGYRPGLAPATVVPTYPPGLPLTIAAARLSGSRAATYVVVPILAGVAVFATFLLGRATGGPGPGLVAATCLALSPVFLRQSTQIMSDVPSAAWWTLSLALACARSTRAAAGSGASAALALLTRPNLAPLALAVVGVLVSRHGPPPHHRQIAGRLVSFLLPFLAGGLFIAGVHTHLYGSPFNSGYGAGHELFALGNIWPNAQRYTHWLADSEAWFLLLAVPLAFSRSPQREMTTATIPRWPLALAAVMTVAAYLPYAVFDDWWYTRFLLPAFPPALVLASHGLFRLLRGRRSVVRLIVGGLAVAVVGWHTRSVLDRLDVLTLAPLEQRYALAGQRLIPPTGSPVVLAGQHSGSVHYYAGVPILRWDLLPARDLDRAITHLRAHGRRPLILLDAPEEPTFRARFAADSAIGRLDWPPTGEVRTPIGVRLYDPADREAYAAGQRIDTRTIFPGRR